MTCNNTLQAQQGKILTEVVGKIAQELHLKKKSLQQWTIAWIRCISAEEPQSRTDRCLQIIAGNKGMFKNLQRGKQKELRIVA